MTQQTSDTTDIRASAALAVLSGELVADTAERIGVPAALVVRWTQQFVDAGSAAVRGESTGDPAHRDRFLALVSHELRTPLTVIRGWVGTLQSVPEEARRELLDTALAAISGHTDRLDRLAGDLIDSASVTLGRLRLDVDDVDLGLLAIETAGSFTGDRIEVETTSVPIIGDRDRLGQVMANLVHDGLARCTGTVHLSVTSDDDWATILLRVPATPPPFDEMHALFEPFEAGTGDSHTGLSLYVCRALAVAHGGQCGVDADDELRFWVRLPVRGPVVDQRR